MSIIKNKQEISGSKARKQVVRLIEAGIKAVKPENLMKKAVRYGNEFNSLIINSNEFNLLTGRIFVVGGGKASGKMAEIFEKIVGVENIAGAIIDNNSYYRAAEKRVDIEGRVKNFDTYYLFKKAN